MDQLTLSPEERHLLDLTAVPLAPGRGLQLGDFLLAEIAEAPRRSRRNRLLGFLAAFVATVTITTGAAYAWISSSVETNDPYTVYCMPDTDPDRGDSRPDDRPFGTVTSVGPIEGGPPSEIAGADICRPVWETGAVRLPGTPQPTTNRKYPVPAVLTACVDRTGATVVFPADASICTRLGWSSLKE